MEQKMKHTASGGLKAAGFTLLEILVAIMIFAVVVTTLYGSLRAVLSKNEAINHGADVYEMARNCLSRIFFDLTAVYVELPPLYQPPGFSDPPDLYRFAGDQSYVGAKKFSRARFASTAHLPMGKSRESGIAGIFYYVQERQSQKSDYVLKRSDTAYPDEADDQFEEKDSDPILCENIEEFSLTYYDGEGEAYEKWDSDSDAYKYATPRMVAVGLKLKQGNETYSFYTKVNLPVYREEIENKKK